LFACGHYHIYTQWNARSEKRFKPLASAASYTRDIFRLQGAAQQFAQSTSLPEALEIWKYPTNQAAAAR
jgi:hypothetical protein